MRANPGGQQSDALRHTKFGDLEQSMVFEVGHRVLYSITVSTVMRHNGSIVMETRVNKDGVQYQQAKQHRVTVTAGTVLEADHAIVGLPKVCLLYTLHCELSA